jgi:hypothetical protein
MACIVRNSKMPWLSLQQCFPEALPLVSGIIALALLAGRNWLSFSKGLACFGSMICHQPSPLWRWALCIASVMPYQALTLSMTGSIASGRLPMGSKTLHTYCQGSSASPSVFYSSSRRAGHPKTKKTVELLKDRGLAEPSLHAIHGARAKNQRAEC